MPNDVSIQAAPLVQSGNDGIAPVRPAATAAAIDHAGPTPSQSPPSHSPSPNPTLQLDPALGLVVIEFRDDAGTVTSSIPSQQQLAAYRLWQMAGIGSPPNLDTYDAGVATAPEPATVSATASATAPTPAPTMHGGDSQPSGS